MKSAALLPYRMAGGALQVWLAHMGGPFWARKDDAAWSVVKGEYDDAEPAWEAAYREWVEEMGTPAPAGGRYLGSFRQSSRKTITVFAAEVADAENVRFRASMLVEIEWPPRSGRTASVPEIDRAAWFPLDEAERKILTGQRPILDALGQAALTGVWPLP